MKDIEPTSTTGSASRREFIKKTAATAAAVATTGLFKTPVYGQNQAPSAGRVIGANDRITVGFIGIGPNIGMDHFEGIHKTANANNTAVAAVCDLFSKRRDWGKNIASLKDADVYTDYRKLLERKDIDAVLIATHDVWHGKLSVDSLEAGKHVYCEKPMTRYLDEAFMVHDTVKKTGKIYQVGSQGCTAGAWHKAAQLIKSDAIGKVIWAQGYYCRNIAIKNGDKVGEWNYAIEKETTPENIDWDAWLGHVSKRPFSAEAFHRWRKYYPFCAGPLGDLVPHRLHPLMLATSNPEFPARVSCIGTTSIHIDKYVAGTPERNVPEHEQFITEFPSGTLFTITASTVAAKSPGFVIYGHKGSLEISDQGNQIQLVPERAYADEVDPVSEKGMQVEDVRAHEKNWFDSIRANKAPNANVDLAIRVQTTISLAEMAERLKTTCLFDEKTRKITTGDGKDLKPLTYGWTTPELS
jgi:predicted dehydrogenase